MGIRSLLSEDPASAALNTAAHAPEHCAIDRESLQVLRSAVGRQLLVRRSAKAVALYTVVECIDRSGPAVHVGTAGLARVEGAGGDLPSAKLEVTVEADFTRGERRTPVRLTEELLGGATAGLAVLAPHGGRIEIGTDDQARAVFATLAREDRPVRAWLAQGFNPSTGAHRCWHITASELSEHSFPALGALFGPGASRGPFSHAVAFHGQNDAEAIIVGGGLPRDAAQTALKKQLRDRVRDALDAVMEDPPAVVVRRSGLLAGVERANIVNRVAVRGNGLQLEQPASVRADEGQRNAVAEAVAAFYADLV